MSEQTIIDRLQHMEKGCNENLMIYEAEVCFRAVERIKKLEAQLAKPNYTKEWQKISDLHEEFKIHINELEEQLDAVRESVDTNPCSEFCKGWCDCVDTKMANIRAAIGEEDEAALDKENKKGPGLNDPDHPTHRGAQGEGQV